MAPMVEKPTRHKGYFYFDPDDPIYEDHFPASPVVPGSIIVQAFITALGRFQYDDVTISVTNFRFKHFISPGRYAFSIEPKSDGRLTCCLYDRGKVVAKGTL